ncbi:MAG: NPCBM/NEW2 domain-containing protein [Armatimonadetes bacterium]|nr:NPCBM/NEW2 domain-containing protein [Armatimonadota bacterium]
MARLRVTWMVALVAGAVYAAPPVVNKDQMAEAGPNVGFVSEVVTKRTPGRSVDIDVALGGAKFITLLVSEGGDSYACDHCDWVDARFVGPAGTKRLTELDWIFGVTGWGTLSKSKSPAGSPMSIDGKPQADGLGIHSPGLVLFAVPEGYDRFQARAGIDDSGANQSDSSSVQFVVITGVPTAKQCAMLGVQQPPDPTYQQRIAELTRRYSGEVAKEFIQLQKDLERRGWTQTFNGGIAGPEERARQSVSDQAMLKTEDRDPVDVVLRRTRALLDDLSAQVKLDDQGKRLAGLEAENKTAKVEDLDARLALFGRTVALRREIAFANPLLRGMDQILFITREALPTDEYNDGNHMCDQFFGFHATLHGKTKGDGVYVLSNPFGAKPTVRNVLENSVVESGLMKGQKLDHGGFLSPDLSFDGKDILFAWTEGRPDLRQWKEDTTFHIFRVRTDGTGLTQLTDGSVNDFDPCWLPNGRIAFISERRGGFGRCHGRPVPSYTLHSMLDDGTDIVRFSPHETNEWQPSVANDGRIIYTRWDYVDRGFNQAHHAWVTYPDGRDARALNGNTHENQRTAPHQEMQVRAVPNSPLLVAITSGHHTEARGSIVLIDPRAKDDGAMSAIKRVTPDQLFPEAEWYSFRGSSAYATPWPLSEKYFLCVYDHDANAQWGELDPAKRNYALTLLDVYGNKEIIYRDPRISCLDPIPLRPRTKPPVIPHGTAVGLPRLADGTKPVPLPADQIPKTGRIGLINVYDSLRPLPAGAKVTALRIWQILPKSTPLADVPRIGYGSQKPAKASLGTVPVEADGSAWFEAPVGVPLLYHALDETGAAVQGMRSASYVQPGETLTCTGCHNQRVQGTSIKRQPLAMKRAASTIEPDPDGTHPFNYPRLVQPVLDAKCVSCHKPGGNGPDLTRGNFAQNANLWYTSFANLRGFVKFYDNADWVEPYTVPGNFGAHGSRLYDLLKKGHHDVKLDADEWRRLTIWMDSNGLFFGHEHELMAQAEGKVVLPSYE